jgi:hypothetical protein
VLLVGGLLVVQLIVRRDLSVDIDDSKQSEDIERKLAIIKAVREQQEEKDRTFEELRKIGIDPCVFKDDPFFLS